MPEDHRRDFGQAANAAGIALTAAFKKKFAELERLSADPDSIDVTLPGQSTARGSLHPITTTAREICAAFGSMGFDVIEGPEVELDHYNFEMLNIPEHHPARDSFNTLWLESAAENPESPLLLRTHTSPMQIRTMERQDPPIRVVVPGKVYR